LRASSNGQARAVWAASKNAGSSGGSGALHDTAYALAVEIAVLDVQLPQEELVLLEMVRDRLKVNSLVTGAIEASARARMRKA
jgi:hypothetical protein